ncbi:MAG: type II secretion system F family protein [Chitinophagales bacterium]
MPRFAYAVRDGQGQISRGVMEADSAGVAAARLRSEGYYVTSITPDTRAGSPAVDSRTPGGGGVRVNAKALSIFFKQISTLLQAGVPITNALGVAASQPGKRGWSEVIQAVRRHVEAGESLSGALSHYGRSFPNLAVRLIEAGETSGTLDKTFDRLAGHYNREHELNQKIVGSLTYPVVILFVAIIVVVVLLVFVLPNFMTMFSTMGRELPLPTRVMLGIGNGIKQHGLLLLTALVALVTGGMFYVRTEAGAKARDAFLLRLPLLRGLMLQMELARFARTFGALLAGGVPALQAMLICSRVANNRVLSESFSRVADQVRGGASLSNAMEKTGLIPGMMLQMVAVGESTGSLDLILDNVADLYERETEATLGTVTTLIEPAVIVFVGLIVAGIIASVMFPMFEMVRNVS